MNNILHGSKVNLCHLNFGNLDEYLIIYKLSSVFASAYETMPDLWETQKKSIRNGMDQERYLVIEKETEISCGIVEFHYIFKITPEINIMIAPEYRQKGYGYEASKILIDKVLNDGKAEYIIWNTFASNKASCRIAEKLGGIKENRDNFVGEALAQVFDKDVKDYHNVIDTITYKITK